MFVEVNEASSGCRLTVNADQIWQARGCDNDATELYFANGEKLVVAETFLDVVYLLKTGHPKEGGGYSKAKMTFA